MIFSADPEGADEQFEAFLDEVLNQLAAIGREGVDLAARLTERYAEFETTVEATDFNTAGASFLMDLRTALHAAGCATADWPRFAPHGQHVRELRTV
ncbi:hypothetical protein O7606_22695 [Micromonospora sp. WMMD882]|uniref:hypothetical protein n=1 Tax=Micromonospora sp. WMMD882 TaxID=3015151 RepID=UPI00248B0E83|nr:hypothetical protein [Micromonospora sp. WMMD882]WBB78971.1 hypothetical protein O7606_22695 [Micromonospora sp. WMMD882]